MERRISCREPLQRDQSLGVGREFCGDDMLRPRSLRTLGQRRNTLLLGEHIGIGIQSTPYIMNNMISFNLQNQGTLTLNLSHKIYYVFGFLKRCKTKLKDKK